MNKFSTRREWAQNLKFNCTVFGQSFSDWNFLCFFNPNLSVIAMASTSIVRSARFKWRDDTVRLFAIYSTLSQSFPWYSNHSNTWKTNVWISSSRFEAALCSLYKRKHERNANKRCRKKVDNNKLIFEKRKWAKVSYLVVRSTFKHTAGCRWVFLFFFNFFRTPSLVDGGGFMCLCVCVRGAISGKHFSQRFSIFNAVVVCVCVHAFISPHISINGT